MPQNNNTPVYHGQRAGGRLLIAPLIKERRDLIDTIRVETGFVRHFCLGLFADLLVVHQTAEQQLKLVRQRFAFRFTDRLCAFCRVLVGDVIIL